MLKNVRESQSVEIIDFNCEEIKQLSSFFEILINIDQKIKKENKYENIRNTNNSN